ncbi:hypothetical protein FGADI_1956 [Fusarium gaditjirri]|uniref:Heterokaryon incompatibility domain-containing protein n=1 Tax=Fusarium gaditjirri TaxID=282569 RepID=A0A8H4TJM3_9HYPO|nr:hypothetical protein FGADI_1956 [Fusarium gaditjirri]
MAPQDVIDEFYRYVQNDIPLRVLFVPEMKLVDRFFVQDYYFPQIQHISEEEVEANISRGSDRETAARLLVSNAVQYAIFSHRWLPQDEPTFRDILDGTAKGLGRDKLWKFCEIVRSYEIMFAWSDTCCIDKSSSSELDESIRSMFRWYRNSTTCLVHLAQTTSINDLSSDEWFERGWTLQELLAPIVTKLFNKNWRPLADGPNDKNNDEVLDHLCVASGCPEKSLRGFVPGPFYVAPRMSWAARRKTTRGEDMAYSLMGIFDVTMQTMYGEGAERAFCRLIEKIMISNGNTSVLNWAGKPAVSHSSRAFPSSPRNYLGHPHVNCIRKLDISITSLGLRIPLVLLPLGEPNLLERAGGSHTRVEFSISGDDSREALPSIHQPIIVDILKGWSIKQQKWALGVFNYMPPYGNRATPRPGLRQSSIAYLLSRRETPSSNADHPVVNDDLRFYGWRKVPTATFVRFVVEGIQRDEVIMVLKIVESTQAYKEKTVCLGASATVKSRLNQSFTITMPSSNYRDFASWVGVEHGDNQPEGTVTELNGGSASVGQGVDGRPHPEGMKGTNLVGVKFY